MYVNNSKVSLLICSLIALFLAFEASMAPAVAPSMVPTVAPVDNRKIKVKCTTTIFVDQSGRGNFKSIQAAIETVPQNNRNWICILVKQGVYRERVYIPRGRSFIYLAGDGPRRTYVVSDGLDPIDQTATLIIQADNIIAEGISFNNSYNSPPIGTRNLRRPAVAAKIEGDKNAFYECGFYGLQDTLWDASGRHYFKLCTIEGAVDFIFGSGQSIYEKCVISVVGDALNGGVGYITAQGREDPNETNGYVFKHSNINGNGKTYLGRPWRKYARVVFYQTFMSDIIVPQGWDASANAGGQEGLLTFLEIECLGKGADTSGRVKWANKMPSPKELQQLISIKYINSDGWLTPDMLKDMNVSSFNI